MWRRLGAEFFGTFWLTFAGCGLCLTLIHLFLIPVTNASVNPARSTGPALFAGGPYIAQLWLFWLAPILGAAVAGVISRWQHDEPDALNAGQARAV